jgi:hypothetical protein
MKYNIIYCTTIDLNQALILGDVRRMVEVAPMSLKYGFDPFKGVAIHLI